MPRFSGEPNSRSNWRTWARNCAAVHPGLVLQSSPIGLLVRGCSKWSAQPASIRGSMSSNNGIPAKIPPMAGGMGSAENEDDQILSGELGVEGPGEFEDFGGPIGAQPVGAQPFIDALGRHADRGREGSDVEDVLVGANGREPGGQKFVERLVGEGLVVFGLGHRYLRSNFVPSSLGRAGVKINTMVRKDSRLC